MDRIFIGVAWPYANGSLHLGTLAGALLPGDIFGRYHRMKGNDVLMVSGSDEHGTPITITAEKKCMTPKKVVDYYHAEHVQNLRDFSIKFEIFTRTTSDFHKHVVGNVIKKLDENGYIYPKTVRAFYCEHCTRFLPDRYVEGTCAHCGGHARGDQCEECGTTLDVDDIKYSVCKICGGTPILRETEHLFFRLSSFEGQLLLWLNEKTFWRDNVLKFTLNFIRAGLRDRAITRDLEWGVQAPIAGFESKRIYVWFEAVTGYLSASMEWAEKTGNPNAWRKWWENGSRHYYFLAKDNIPFHTIIWPAMLMGHGGFTLPYDVPANEYLTLSGAHFSKSRGIGIWLPDIIREFHPDAIRYYLSINMPENRDTDWNWEDFTAKINNELVATYGNFIHRVLSFAYANFGCVPPAGIPLESECNVMKLVIESYNLIGDSIEKCHFKEGIKYLMRIAQLGNQYMNTGEPWRLIKKDPLRCATVIYTCLRIIRALAIASAPYMPQTADRVWHLLGYSGNVHEQPWADNFELEKQKLEKPEPLFVRIEMKEPQHDPFEKLDLRVARIISVENHPNADRLYILQIDIGVLGTRQIVAGIRPWYTQDELKGGKIVVVTNLKKAHIRGVESNGMLLAVDTGEAAILLKPHANEGESVRVDGIIPKPVAEVSYDEFKELKMMSRDGTVVYHEHILKDCAGDIRIDKPVGNGYPIR